MIKKSLIFLFCIISLTSIVIAQSVNIEFPLGDSFEAGNNINFVIRLLDSNNNPISDSVSVTFQYQDIIIEKTVQSNQPSEINLGEDSLAGEWRITANYQDSQESNTFFIKSDEKLDFVIEEDKLIITNTGNTKYTKTIEITIGETPGPKKLDLDVGEKSSLILVAPEGNYNIKITNDKKETLFTKNNVALRGRGLTGEAMGVLDEQASGRSGLTGGISPSQDSDDALLNYVKNSSFVYVFILVVFGAGILLAIERRYRKKAQ